MTKTAEYIGEDAKQDRDRCTGIWWPEVLNHGEIATAILPCDVDDEDALMEAGMLMSAVLTHDPPTIV